jgi:shikimate 5-dehydrogenase
MDWIDSRSKKSGAINLIVSKNNKLYGYNTELYAIMDVLKVYIEKNRGNLLVIGCGVGGKAAAIASRMLDAETYLAGPTLEMTEKVASQLDDNIKCITYPMIPKHKISFDIVINTLPGDLSIGSSDEGLTVADMIRERPPKIGIDITRSMLWTPFLSVVESRGGEAVPGSEVLVHTIKRDQKLLLKKEVPLEMIEDILRMF